MMLIILLKLKILDEGYTGSYIYIWLFRGFVMINFIYGMICGLGIVVIVGLIFMLKAYKRQKFNRTHKFITFPIVNKEELKDNTRYILVKTFLCELTLS